jgi:dTDP-4-dehydrorhamnose reductase
MRILVIGAGGQLGLELMRRATLHNMSATGLDLPEFDITDIGAVGTALTDDTPQLVVNAAAYTAVDRAEDEPETAFAVNQRGPANLADACFRCGIPLVHVSTDYVFDGVTSQPWTEEDRPAPLGVYGKSKLGGEVAVRETQPQHFILRTSWLFGVHGHNFVKTILRLARQQEELRIVADQHGCPTAASHLADVILTLADRFRKNGQLQWGTYHYCDTPPTTWHGFAETIVALARERSEDSIVTSCVKPIASADFPTRAPRPAYSVLSCSKLERAVGIKSASWQSGLADVLEEYLNGSA